MIEDHSNLNKEQVNIFKLGSIKSKTLMTILFYLGIIPSLFISIEFGNYISKTHTVFKTVKTENNMYTEIETNFSLLGFLEGIALFICLIIFWRVICELISLLFRYFELKIEVLGSRKGE